jgi:hypothetical protein
MNVAFTAPSGISATVMDRLYMKRFGLPPALQLMMSFSFYSFTHGEIPSRDESICARPLRH